MESKIAADKHIAQQNVRLAALDPALPEHGDKTYSPELIDSYTRRFLWTPKQVTNNKGMGFAIKKCIAADQLIETQKKEIAALMARSAAMLALIGKITKKPNANAANAAG